MASKMVIVSATVAALCAGVATQTSTAAPANASPKYLQPCSDQSKLAVDPASGVELVCTGEVWDQAPSVPAGTHRTGTPCQSDGAESTSDDGYLILCSAGAWIHFHV